MWRSLKKVQTELDVFDGWYWQLKAHESILAQAKEINVKYIVAWWVGKNGKHLGHEDDWSKWIIMNVYIGLHSKLYIGSSLHIKQWYENWLCICIAYLTSMSIGACCLFFVHTLVHISLIFFVEILPICWLLVDQIGNIETLSISNVITRMRIMRIRELEWISCEISFGKSIWIVWESAKLVWKLLERNAQRDNKHTVQKC